MTTIEPREGVQRRSAGIGGRAIERVKLDRDGAYSKTLAQPPTRKPYGSRTAMQIPLGTKFLALPNSSVGQTERAVSAESKVWALGRDLCGRQTAAN